MWKILDGNVVVKFFKMCERPDRQDVNATKVAIFEIFMSFLYV